MTQENTSTKAAGLLLDTMPLLAAREVQLPPALSHKAYKELKKKNINRKTGITTELVHAKILVYTHQIPFTAQVPQSSSHSVLGLGWVSAAPAPLPASEPCHTSSCCHPWGRALSKTGEQSISSRLPASPPATHCLWMLRKDSHEQPPAMPSASVPELPRAVHSSPQQPETQLSPAREQQFWESGMAPRQLHV